jgi:hypothetical protein
LRGSGRRQQQQPDATQEGRERHPRRTEAPAARRHRQICPSATHVRLTRLAMLGRSDFAHLPRYTIIHEVYIRIHVSHPIPARDAIVWHGPTHEI